MFLNLQLYMFYFFWCFIFYYPLNTSYVLTYCL